MSNERTYEDGIIEGIRRYAWWKDGVQYVGTTGKILRQAIKEIENEFKNEEKEWCCWTLSESEIEHVAEEVFNTGYVKGLLTDDEIEEIVEDFKDRMGIAFEEWEENLKEIVENLWRKK